jgi:membrane protein YdbS with pleckstrin-like domain
MHKDIVGPDGPLDFTSASTIREVLSQQLGTPFVVVEHGQGFAVRQTNLAGQETPAAIQTDEAKPPASEMARPAQADTLVIRPDPRAMWHMYPAVLGGLFLLLSAAIPPWVQALHGYLSFDWATALVVSGAALALYALFKIYLPVLLHRYTVTSDAVEATVGIIKRDTTRVRLEHLRSVGMRQTIADRILNVGDLDFYSAGSGAVDVVFSDIRSPWKIKAEIHRRIEANRRGGRADD